ncbi:MAG TPA: thioredoxin [Clostridia bacterium]|nr:thioredoxin [Clostridia bacterium]
MSIVLTKENFDTTIENSAKPVLVDFWATWCGPCKMLGPIIEEISVDYKDKAVVAKLNVDDEGEIAEKFGIMSIPSVLIFKNGQLVEKMIGFRKKEQIAAIIDKYL